VAKAPAFQMYASDFKMDTESWTVTETGIYIRLLFHQWINKELPPEPSRLARIAGCDVRTFNRTWQDTIAKKFSVVASGGLQNYRLEESRKERMEFIENAVISGSLGGKKTQENKRKETSTPSSTPSSENKALLLLSSSSTSNKDIKAKSKDFTLPTKEEILNYSLTKIEECIEILCYKIHHADIWGQVYSFKGRNLKFNKNERAILHVLIAIYTAKKKPSNYWKYATAILSKEDQTYNERDNTKNSQ
jgi:uncharacterized protein YdaU (DUF1376 family)